MIEVFLNGSTFDGRNGDAILLPTACTVTAQVNGTWSLRIEHPLDADGRWRYIDAQNVLRVPSHNGSQLFRIKRAEKNDSAVIAEADPIFFDAGSEVFLLDTRVVSQTGQAALNTILSGSSYTGVSDIDTQTTAYYVRKNAMEAIGGGEDNSFLSRWGGEVEYDNYTIRIMRRLGADNNVFVRTGKNLPRNGLRYTVDESNVINRIVPLAYNGHRISGSSPWVDASGATTAMRHYGVVTFENIRLAGDTGYSTNDTVPDYITVCATQTALNVALRQAAADYFTATKCYQPKIEIEADIAVLKSFAEYKDYQWVESIGLGDTVYLYNKRMGVGVTDGDYDPVPIRVREIEWDCIRNRANRIVARSEESSVSYQGASVSVGSGGESSDSGIYRFATGGTVSLTSGTSWQNVQVLTIPAGSWVVSCTCAFASNATGRRGFCLANSATGSQTGFNVLATSAAVSGTYTVLRFTFPITLTEETTYYLNAYQNSGGSLNVYPRVHMMRVD